MCYQDGEVGESENRYGRLTTLVLVIRMARGQLINLKELIALKAPSETLDDFMYHFTNFALSKTRVPIDDPRFQALLKHTEQSPQVKRLFEK